MLTKMLRPNSKFRLVTIDWCWTRSVLCNCQTSRCHFTKLFLGALTVLTVACSDGGPEPVSAISVRSDSVATPSVDSPIRPNTATLTWDAVSHPGLRGYRIYYGPASDMYLQLRGRGIDVGNVTTYTVTGLVSRKRYYFAVTAYTGPNEESDFSNQVFKDIP